MKLILAPVVILFLVGCSSSQKSSATKADLKATPRDQGLVEMIPQTQSKMENLPPVAEEKQTSTADKLMLQLQEAIQKQDDRNIAIYARELLIRSPNNISALNALALFYFKKGQFDTAKTLLNKAISTEPEVSLLYSNLGFVMQTLKEDDEATRLYRQALKIDPFNAIAAANVGSLYLKRKDYRKAQVAYEIAVDKGQRDWKTLSNYGVVLTALGIYPLAYTQLKTAATQQSQNLEVNLNLAILLIEHMNKLPEGLEVINKMRFIGPGPDLRKKISELENRAKSVLK